MKKLNIILLLGILLLLSVQGCQRKVGGTYMGLCRNLTYGDQAQMLLVINQQRELVRGTLNLSGDLSGGGQIEGRIDGSTVSFTTSDPIIGQITWIGSLKGSAIEGEYFVETPVIVSALTGVRNQQGIWRVQRQ